MSPPRSGPRPLDADASEPLWSQLLTDLRRRLIEGEFADGFPTDRHLMADYGVSRHTVREAASQLQREGLLTRHKGRGSFVQPLALEQRIGPLYSLFRSIEEQGHVQRSDVLVLEEIEDAEIAERLGLPRSSALFHLRRVRRADDVPFAVDDIWLSASVAAPLFAVDFEHTGVYRELERLTDVRPIGGWERIRPGMPTSDERRLLGIPGGEAVFVVTRYTESASGPLEWRRTVIRGDSYTFTTTWASGTGATGPATSRTVSSRFGVGDEARRDQEVR